MGQFNQCKSLEEPGLTIDGGFAEYVKVEAKYCYLLTDILSHHGDKQTALSWARSSNRRAWLTTAFLYAARVCVPAGTACIRGRAGRLAAIAL